MEVCVIILEVIMGSLENMWEILYKVIYAIIDTIGINLTFFNIENLYVSKKSCNKRYVISFLLFFLVIYIFSFSKFEYMITPLQLIIGFIIVYSKLKSLIQALIINSLFLIVFMLSDGIAGFIIVVLLKKEFVAGMNSLYMSTICLISFLSILISYLLSKIYKKYSYKKISFREFIKNRIVIVLFLVISLLVGYVNVIFLKYIVKDLSLAVVSINILFLALNFIITIIIFYINNKSIEVKLNNYYKEQEYEKLKEYTNTIEQLVEEIRNFKHDYRNILYSLGDYIEDGNMAELKKYYEEEILLESKKILGNDKNLYLLKNIKITPLKSLLSCKLINAKYNGIKVDIEVLDEINAINISNIDICRIMGILLDNAIEASVECEDKHMSFIAIKDEDKVIFIIKNTFKKQKNTIPINDIYKKGISSKGENRGLGLSNLMDIINEKYSKNISIYTNVKENIFIQKLEIKIVKK